MNTRRNIFKSLLSIILPASLIGTAKSASKTFLPSEFPIPIGMFGSDYFSEINCEQFVKLLIMKRPTEFERILRDITDNSTIQEIEYVKSLKPLDYPSTVAAKNFQTLC